MPRIVEALQSNVWTGMEFCTSNRPSLMAAAAAAATSSRSGGGGGGGGVADGAGSVSGSSGAEDGTAALSPSVGDGQQEVVSECRLSTIKFRAPRCATMRCTIVASLCHVSFCPYALLLCANRIWCEYSTRFIPHMLLGKVEIASIS